MPAAKGNDYNRKYTEAESMEMFLEAFEWVKSHPSKALCIEDVIIEMGIPRRTFYSLCNWHEDLHSIKEDIKMLIISKVNKAALSDEFRAAPAIWRLKQMGESDQTNINVTSSGKSLPDWMDED